ncbi:MAG TPA: DUF4421 family protein [Catalimonadaceae bacterium]|nr:DUF4421 family protein [Catalimonadaceae bacterium]
MRNQASRKNIQYKTATATRLGLSFDYRWLAFELFTQIPGPENEEKGVTKNSGIYFRANRSRYWANLIYQNFSGFYWDNSDPLTQLQQGRSFPLREDIKDRLLQANAFYIFSPQKFSNMAAQGENELQLRSGGSFFAGFGFIFNRFSGDSSLIPRNKLAFFPNERAILEFVNRSYLLYGGYAYSLIIAKHFYLTGYAAPGLARFSTINRFEENQREQIKGEWALRLDTRIALGYNSKNYFGGILLTSFLNNQDLGTGTNFSFGFQTFRIFFGRRFELPHRLGFLGL